MREALLAQQQTDMASIDRKHITDEEKMSRLYDLEKNGQEVDRVRIMQRIEQRINTNIFKYVYLQKLPFPKGAFFILASKFCDWFAFNGVKSKYAVPITNATYF